MGTHIARLTSTQISQGSSAARTDSAFQRVIERIRAEFQEMPGMRLTGDQIARLCGIDRHRCSEALERLLAAHYLQRAEDGSYSRPSDMRIARGFPRARPVKT